jgi:hypothetical protein
MPEEHQLPVSIDSEWDVDEETGLVFVNCFWPAEDEDSDQGGMVVSVTLSKSLSDKLIAIRKNEEGQEWPEGERGAFDTVCQLMSEIVAFSGALPSSFVLAMLHDPLLGSLHHTMVVGGINGIKEQLERHGEAYLDGLETFKKQGNRIKQFYRLFRSTKEDDEGK